MSWGSSTFFFHSIYWNRFVPWQSSFVIFIVPACYYIVSYCLEIDIHNYSVSSVKLQGINWSSGKHEEWDIVWSMKYCMSRKWRKSPFLKLMWTFLPHTLPHYQENNLLIVVAHFLVCAFTWGIRIWSFCLLISFVLDTYEETKYAWIYSQTLVHECLGSQTIRFTNKFSQHKASRMTYCLELWTCKLSRDRKKKKNPLQNSNISLPHHLPLTPSTLLHTGMVKLN